MRSQLERAINLASRTGDKIIVVDELNDRSSVVMSLDEYERLLKGQNKGRNDVDNLTEEELLDKINHDIISWKDANSDNDFLPKNHNWHDSWEHEDDFDDEAEDELDVEDEDETDEDLNFDDDDEEIDTDIFPDFTTPNSEVEKNIISEPEESSFAKATEDESELAPEKVITEEPIIAEAKVDEDENVYYYHEPESEKQEETAKDESGFTSIKDELKKNKKAWAIPSEVKEKAEDVKM